MKIRVIISMIFILLFIHNNLIIGTIYKEKFPSWVTTLQSKTLKIAKEFDGEFGLYVKDLESDATYSINAHSPWYLASTVKLLIAVVLLREVQNHKISLNTKVLLEKKDYVDGAGKTNWLEPGSKPSILYLLQQMLLESDNTATDLILREIGVNRVNDFIVRMGLDFGPISTLLNVRKNAYSLLHPKAMKLSNMDYFTLKKIKNGEKKIQKFVQLLGISREELKLPSVEKAFVKYYKRNHNTASLVSYGKFLELLVTGQLLDRKYTKQLLTLMQKVKTGKDRLLKGFNKKINFAHKTGTQYSRLCHMGIASKNGKGNRVIITMCAKNFKNRVSGKAVFAKIAKAIVESKVFK